MNLCISSSVCCCCCCKRSSLKPTFKSMSNFIAYMNLKYIASKLASTHQNQWYRLHSPSYHHHLLAETGALAARYLYSPPAYNLFVNLLHFQIDINVYIYTRSNSISPSRSRLCISGVLCTSISLWLFCTAQMVKWHAVPELERMEIPPLLGAWWDNCRMPGTLNWDTVDPLVLRIR